MVCAKYQCPSTDQTEKMFFPSKKCQFHEISKKKPKRQKFEKIKIQFHEKSPKNRKNDFKMKKNSPTIISKPKEHCYNVQN